ncbi:hypothetical protein [Nocardia tenerifensis]|nr:hypothetical protein [Nocardia tenerifensis]
MNTTDKKADSLEPEFKLSASESELLEEFGVLLAAEYTYNLSA